MAYRVKYVLNIKDIFKKKLLINNVVTLGTKTIDFSWNLFFPFSRSDLSRVSWLVVGSWVIRTIHLNPWFPKISQPSFYISISNSPSIPSTCFSKQLPVIVLWSELKFSSIALHQRKELQVARVWIKGTFSCQISLTRSLHLTRGVAKKISLTRSPQLTRGVAKPWLAKKFQKSFSAFHLSGSKPQLPKSTNIKHE